LVGLDAERALVRTVVFTLAMEALEFVLGVVRPDKDDPSVEDLVVDRERQDDDSNGAGRGFNNIVLFKALRWLVAPTGCCKRLQHFKFMTMREHRTGSPGTSS
jgi:hypothetical protein